MKRRWISHLVLALSAGAAHAAPNDYWKLELLHSFDGGAGGYLPYAGLVESSKGVFWGTTSLGGVRDGSGTVFKFVPGAAPTVMHTFANDGAAGGRPMAALLPVGRVLYGTTALGGSQQKGTLFKMSTLGSFTLLHSMAGTAGNEGSEPRAPLIRGSDGKFYGTTRYGGAHQKGTVFRMESSGAVTTLRSFGSPLGAGNDGEMPMAPLLQRADGLLYGSTALGGANDGGVLFRMGTTGASFTLLASLGAPGSPRTGGCTPQAGLVPATGTSMAGTTTGCGSAGSGAIFSLTTGGAVSWLHSFVPATNGAPPGGELVQRSDGRFYGVTQDGAIGCGSVYSKNLSGSFARIAAFPADGSLGCGPVGALTNAQDGALYGVTMAGGAFNKGVIFRVRHIVSLPD
ncbi:MAG TPA: choice-of-anchor tandem repeat GloVer-containing protein [Ideonella sp.]|nr:choice-of-anchor tandem repeat GloVer-containing protein [Ideonella sp.]